MGDLSIPQPNPWVQEFPDFQNRKVTITVTFNTSTRRITGATVHRDAGCLWHSVVFGDPSNPASPRLTAPGTNAVDVSFTGAQVTAASGFTTVEQAMTVQVTAEP